MLRIAICDYEKITVDLLCKKIRDFAEQIPMDVHIDSFTDGEKFEDLRDRYDIVFLELGADNKDGVSGMKTLRAVDKHVKIVIISYTEAYMKDGYEVHAFAYLTKPIMTKKLYDLFYDVLIYSDKKKVKIPEVKFNIKNGTKIFPVHQIAYFEYMNRNVLIHDDMDRIYEIPKEKISNIAQKMKKFNFDVPHKSFVVNLMQIEYIKGYNIYLKSKAVVPLSQKNSKHFRQIKYDFFENKTT